MADRPGEEPAERTRVGLAIGSSVLGNSTAFGFSIMITMTFGVVSRTTGSPTIPEILYFGTAAAIAVAALEGAITRGFRDRIEEVPPEVTTLGTALNFASVAAAVSSAALVAEVVAGSVTWPIAAYVAATVYVLTESAEIVVAELVQKARGDVEADEPQE